MERYKLEAVVVGAGVVGLAVAKALAESGKSVWIIDKESSFGRHTSSRNSEVIHAGIYYPNGSLKAKLCVEGKAKLYRYLDQKGVPYKQTGKLIVATNQKQLTKLQAIKANAAGNGVDDLELLNQSQVALAAFQLRALGAISSPSTGIVDSYVLMQSLLSDAEVSGASFVANTELRLLSCAAHFFELELVGQDSLIETPILVNAAGLFAPSLLEGAEGFPQYLVPKPSFAKGSYFTYAGKTPFKQLIYPVPEDGGLGVHLTLDLAGAARFGPDVDWQPELTAVELDRFDYSVDPQKRGGFAERIAEFWPSVRPNALLPDYAGLRPKISFGGELYSDFSIQCADEHGLDGLVNLLGIESPGLTSCLAIAEHVVKELS